MKNKTILLTLLMLLSSSCSTQSETINNPSNNQVDIVPFEHDYYEVDDYSMEWEDIFSLPGEYYVYLYSLSCSHCQELKNYIIEKAIIYENIFFVKNSADIKIGKDTFLTIGTKNPDDFYIMGFPSLAKIKDKICVMNIAGNSLIKEELK